MSGGEATDPCGDCVMCQTKLVSALVSDEMRDFLTMCVESAIQSLAHGAVDGDLNLVRPIVPMLGVLTILDPERAEYVTGRLDDMGITILIGEDE